jgi:phosphatidylglycerol:prolipoprotein diacylglycerol transferase
LDFPLSVIVVPESTREPVEIPAQSLPGRSLKIHPTQIYAAVNAFLLCGLLYFWHSIRTFAGQVFALLMILYPISRFLEEMIRTDEQGMFGTQFSIGQWVSLATIAVGFAFYIVLSNIKQTSSAQEGQ